MRKAFSIFLLLVMLFNIVGYRLWFFYAEKQSDATIEANLNRNNYDENDLITVQIPLNNPYVLEQSEFQRIDGELNYHGTNYRFVKRKISGGNLILKCIPDTRKMVLKKAKAEYGNAANDLANTSKNSPHSGSQKSFFGSDYISQNSDYIIDDFSSSSKVYFRCSVRTPIDPQLAAPAKPPQVRA